MRVSKVLKKTIVLILIGWLPLGFIGRCMMKHYWIETYYDSLKKYAWINIDERKQNLLILTGLSGFFYSIFYIASHEDSKWGLVPDFKSEKIPTWEEYQELKRKKDLNIKEVKT